MSNFEFAYPIELCGFSLKWSFSFDLPSLWVNLKEAGGCVISNNRVPHHLEVILKP